MSRKYPILVSAGGNVLSQPAVSLENVGDSNYSLKVNFRRSEDQEIRREGWVKFVPVNVGTVDSQYIFDGAQTLLRLAEIVRGDGTRAIVGASATTIKVFNPDFGVWQVIGSGYSANGLRWQAEAIGGYLVLNNAVDLPVWYIADMAAVTPMYELRDVGVAAVGRISQLNGFLMCGNISFIDENQLNKWMNGYPSYVPSAQVNEAANFASIGETGPGDGGTLYNVTTGTAGVALTLEATQPSPNWWILVKKVDAAFGTLVTLPAIGDQKIILQNQGDVALIWSDGLNYFAKYFANGVVPASNPYGIVTPDIVENVPYRVTWATPGNPTDWAPQYVCYQKNSSANIPLPFATAALKVGDLVGVLGGGPGGGILGGGSDYPFGIPIIAIAGNVITLPIPTDAGLAYPVNVTVVRWADIGSFVGFYDLQGDGSSIIGMAPLQGRLQIYKDGSIFVGTYIAVQGSPFAFVEKYQGYNSPIYGDAIVAMNGQYHIYPGYGGRFYIYDGLTYPVIHKPTDQARDLFFGGLTNETAVWAIDNPLTKELWFCRPGLVFAFDYLKNTVSEIDAEIDAAVFCNRPTSADKWMVLGLGGNTYTYALVQGAVPITTWLRDGQPAVPRLTSGLIQAGNQTDEKMMVEYTPLLSSPSPDMEIEVQIWTTYNPSGALTPMLVDANGNPEPADLPDPAGNNYLPTSFQAIYFQDAIAVVDARDLDCRLSGRLMRFQDVRAGSVTRTSN